jgi:hypothetical protein
VERWVKREEEREIGVKRNREKEIDGERAGCLEKEEKDREKRG